MPTGVAYWEVLLRRLEDRFNLLSKRIVALEQRIKVLEEKGK